MIAACDRWEQIYHDVPLAAVPRHYAGMTQSPFLVEYLLTCGSKSGATIVYRDGMTKKVDWVG